VATFSKAKLSASTNGRPVVVAATATAGTEIHEAGGGSDSGAIDEIWLYATNIDTSEIELTLEWGDAAVTDNIKISIPSKSGLTLVSPGIILTGGLTLKAFAGTASKILLFGYVNRVT